MNDLVDWLQLHAAELASSRNAHARAFEPRQHLVAEVRKLREIVDEAERDAGEARRATSRRSPAATVSGSPTIGQPP